MHTIPPFCLHSITMSHNIGTSTRSLHADDVLNVVSDVAPPMHLSTTFRYSDDPSALIPAADLNSVRIVQCSPSTFPSLPPPYPSYSTLSMALPSNHTSPLSVVRHRSHNPHLLPNLLSQPNPLRNNPHLPPKRKSNLLFLRPLRPPRSPHPPKPTPHLRRRRLPRLPRRNRPLHPSNRFAKTRPEL